MLFLFKFVKSLKYPDRWEKSIRQGRVSIGKGGYPLREGYTQGVDIHQEKGICQGGTVSVKRKYLLRGRYPSGRRYPLWKEGIC